MDFPGSPLGAGGEIGAIFIKYSLFSSSFPSGSPDISGRKGFSIPSATTPDFQSCVNTDGGFYDEFYPGLRSLPRATNIPLLRSWFEK